MNKLNTLTEYIGIALDGDIIALGDCALNNCSAREAVFVLLVIGAASCLLSRYIVRIIKMG